MAQTFAGFMSYVHLDDKHESERLTELCSRLSGEVRMQLGQDFLIFQDRKAIMWGQQWKARIENAIDATTFLIPIITPGFFRSDFCRTEVERFLDREKKLGRADLILPIYYVTCPILNDEATRKGDVVVETIASRQYADWRDLRFEPFTSPAVGKVLATLATHIVQGLERSNPEVGDSAQDAAQANAIANVDDAEASDPTQLRAPANKKEPPTLVVDPLHRGDYLTLEAALQAAQPGSRILLRSGLYREGVVIDKAVEIIGDGAPGEVVIEASGKDAVMFRANMGRIVNCTIRQTGGGKWYGVDIVQGRLDLEDCDITSSSLACVAIHSGADPKLRRNRIHGGSAGGVLVYDGGLGTLEDNEIFGNALSGVEVTQGGNPTVRRNRIYQCMTGIFVNRKGLGLFEDNEISSGKNSGVEIGRGGNPVLRRNKIRDNRQCGVAIIDGGLGTLEDNEISGSELAGIEIRASSPTIRNNRIHDNWQGGMLIHGAGGGTVEDCEIFQNVRAGVEIRKGATPILRRNKIYGGKNSGIFVNDDGLGTIEANEIFENGSVGVTIRSGGNPTIRHNIISRNKYEAIWIYEGGRGVIEDNDLSGNEKGAFDISDDCRSAISLSRNRESSAGNS